MNEQVNRILRMLEEGKIDADAAERLIRALQRTEPASGSERHWPFEGRAETPDIFRGIVRALKAASRRQRRLVWWRYYRFNDRMAACRRKRAAELSTPARIEHLFVHRGLADPDELRPEVTLDQLGFDQFARDILRWALQDEFGIEIQPQEVQRLTTFGSVVEWVESRVAATGTTSQPEPPTPPEPPAPPTPPEPPSEPEAPPEGQTTG